MKSLDEISNPPQKSPIQKFAGLFRMAVHGNETTENEEWLASYKKLLDFKRQLEARKELPGAKVYQKRLYDIIINDNDDDPNSKPDFIDSFQKPMLPESVSAAFSLIEKYKKRTRKQKNLNFKFLSPRFGSLMPDKMQSASKVLSPSVLSFYEDNSTDNLIPVPKLLREAGFEEKDSEIMMDMLMDISGAKKTVDTALEIAKKLNVTGMNKEFYEITKKLDTAFKKLESSFNKHQKSEIDKHGYTFLESEQIKTLMKKHGVSDPQQVDFNIDEYSKQTERQRHINLWKRIEKIATAKKRRRSKRITWNYILEPMILSPYMFAPIFGITVLGPVVLSPNIFSPLILNPAIMAPYILSPGLFMPFIISPFILSPYIMSPILGGPFVLSPYCLSPNIFNPYLMSPLILSPYLLSPDILSPQALGGPILSPSAFSPAVLTESALMVSFLSPTFMS
uniref:Uncharacterized protein n=1 Tax=Syphacia muris TaxID=451379 RepID=A0A0N5ABJ6_9BILA